jgi:serine/threonine protein kinase
MTNLLRGRQGVDNSGTTPDDLPTEDIALETLNDIEIEPPTTETAPPYFAEKDQQQHGSVSRQQPHPPARRPLPSRATDAGTEPYPRQVGPYELLVPIGTGTTATVYLARNLTEDGSWKYVALKRFHPHTLIDDAGLERRVVREVRLARFLRHPNVVSLLDAGEAEGAQFFVMDYVEGDTLSALLHWCSVRRQQVPMPIAMRIVSDLLCGLEAVHTLRGESGRKLDVVHRDVSPPNVLVGMRGVARLIDLGMAKVPTWTQVTGKRRILGRLPYVAPEQIAGTQVDQRSDVWSAAVVAWELFTGRRLFPENSLQALMDRTRVNPPALRTVRRDLPPALDHALASGLSLDAHDRCPSAHALLSRLQRAWEPEGRIAEREEVGKLVHEAVGAKLRAREQAMIALLRYRRALSNLTQSAMRELAEEELSTRTLGMPTLEPGDDEGNDV